MASYSLRSHPLRLIRFPLVLLATGDLALLALRLRPWNEIVNLPGQGTTGYDPVICLISYIVLLYWMGGNRDEKIQQALLRALLPGVLAAALAIGFVYVSLNATQTPQSLYIQIGLLAGAALFWGVAGMIGSKIATSPNIGIAAGVWSAMVSAVFAVAVVLARIDLNNPLPESADPWKQYQGLAIGNQVIQSLVHCLNMATGFLLLSPVVGGVLGLVFAMLAQD